MTKGFYKFMCMATAAAMSLIGCGENEPAPEYGVPVDQDVYQTDNDEYTDATKYGIADADFEPADADEEIPENAPLYGNEQVDYDPLLTDGDEPADQDAAVADTDVEYSDESMDTLYGCCSDEFMPDEDAVIVVPDEMTTDYGPISQPFKKK